MDCLTFHEILRDNLNSCFCKTHRCCTYMIKQHYHCHFGEILRPLASVYLGPGRGGSRLRRCSRCPCLQQRFPAPHGGPRGVPRPEEICNLSSLFCVYPRAFYQLDVPGKPPKRAIREASRSAEAHDHRWASECRRTGKIENFAFPSLVDKTWR